MCDTWTRAQWLANSQPADEVSIYTLKETRYNAAGQAAYTFRENDGWVYAVVSDEETVHYIPSISATYGTTADTAALDCLTRNGFTLTEPPVSLDTPSTTDLVENLA